MTTRDRIACAVGALALALSVGAAAAGPETATVPLKLVQIGGGELKVGIEISLAHGAPQLYTFDTGSSGFYAAYNRRWWSSFERIGHEPIYQTYGDGVTFVAEPVRTTVGIRTDVGEIEAEVDMGRIVHATGGTFGPSTWLDELAAGRPPLFGSFFGDFGSGLRDKNGLFAILPQLAGNLSSGFAVQLGCRGGAEPKVVIGLTEALRARATSWVPMLRDPHSTPFPHSHRPTYLQALMSTDFLFRRGATEYAFTTDSILDTGAPTTNVHEHRDKIAIPDAFFASPEDRTRIRSGARMRATAAGTDAEDGFELALTTGTAPGFNRIDVTRNDARAEVNLGLIPFLRHDVVFDVERGLVGFAPCSPRGGYDPLRRGRIPVIRRGR